MSDDACIHGPGVDNCGHPDCVGEREFRGTRAGDEARIYMDAARAFDPSVDDTEQFCPDCFAGVESSEHHEKCETAS